MRNGKSKIDGFLSDSVLKFSTEIDINTLKTELLLFPVDSPVQCCPEEFMQNFCS